MCIRLVVIFCTQSVVKAWIHVLDVDSIYRTPDHPLSFLVTFEVIFVGICGDLWTSNIYFIWLETKLPIFVACRYGTCIFMLDYGSALMVNLHFSGVSCGEDVFSL